MEPAVVIAIVGAAATVAAAAIGVWVAVVNKSSAVRAVELPASVDEDEKIREQLWRLKADAEARESRVEAHWKDCEERCEHWRKLYEDLRAHVFAEDVTNAAQGEILRAAVIQRALVAERAAADAAAHSALLEQHLRVALVEIHRLQGRPDVPFELGPGDER